MLSLRAHASELTHIAPEWLTLTGVESKLIAEPDAELADFCAAHGLKTMPVLRNLVGDLWQPEAVETLARMLSGVPLYVVPRLRKDVHDLAGLWQIDQCLSAAEE